MRPTGTLIAGRYRVERPLGRGGMAAVFLAKDEKLGRQVAIKRLHADSGDDVERRFAREAKLGASLSHPNLVWVFDTLADEEGVLIVMEYVDGPTLAREISDEPLRPRRAVEVIAAVASALEHAHEQGVVHRDVKPANVLLGRGGVIKLADLGIATVADQTRITRSGVALGSVSYMAPEQLEGERVTPATDVYALATVAFEALTGRKAREGRSPMEVAHTIATKPPPDLRAAWQHAPAEAAEMLSAAMARDPAERPTSACDVASDLARALGEETTARQRLDAARAATGAAAASAAGAAAVEETAEAQPPPDAAPARPAQPPPRQATRPRHPERPPEPRPRQATRARHPERPPERAPAAKRQSRRPLVAGVALLAVAAVVAALASAGGGGDDAADRRPDQPAPSAHDGGGGREEQPQAPPAGTGSGSTGSGAGGSVAEGARLNRQGFALLKQGKNEQAVPVLQRSVAAFPEGTSDLRHAFALYNLGRALRLSGRPDEAITVLERRLKIPNQTGVVQKELDAARKAAG